jgi:hypothetical protein
MQGSSMARCPWAFLAPTPEVKPNQTKPTPRHLSILFTHHLPSLAIIHSFGHAFIILSLLDKHRESAKQEEAFFRDRRLPRLLLILDSLEERIPDLKARIA